MKSVLISVRPKWLEKIVNGEKTIEVRPCGVGVILDEKNR